MKFKKIIITAFIFSLIINITACSESDLNREFESDKVSISDTIYNYETDWQYTFRGSISPLGVVYTPKGYYITRYANGVVEFIDNSRPVYTPLCGKINCNHINREFCNAYLTENTCGEEDGSCNYQALQYYNNKLYFLTYPDGFMTMDVRIMLSCSDIDGKNIKNITEIKSNLGFVDWAIHRGYVYCFTDHKLERFSLNDPEKKEVIMEVDKYSIGSNMFFTKFFYGDYLYVNYRLPIEKEEISYKEYFSIIDLNTKKVEDFEYEEKCPMITAAANGKLYFFLMAEGKEVPILVKYYTCNLDFSDINELITVKPGEFLLSDSKYLYFNNGNNIYGETVRELRKKEEGYCGQTITVYDFDMNEVDSFVLPCEKPTLCVNGCDPNRFIFFLHNNEKEDAAENEREFFDMYLFDKSKIGTYNGGIAELTKVESWKTQ